MSELQFDRAEFAQQAPARVQCTTCKQDVVQSYYELGGRIICSSCREAHESGQTGFGGVRFLRAFFAGLLVAAAGSLLWYAIRAVSDYEISLIYIAVGVGVGKAVSWGSRGKGGWLYQLMAMGLTYTSAVMTWVPAVAEGTAARNPGASSDILYMTAVVLSFFAPFFFLLDNIIAVLIIAFGVWEAWKLNRRVKTPMTGPYSVMAAAPPLNV